MVLYRFVCDFSAGGNEKGYKGQLENKVNWGIELDVKLGQHAEKNV
jgi:hypothetical protein